MKKILYLCAIPFLLYFVTTNSAKAICALDNDWPQKPCYDEYPQPSLEQMRKDWEGYYQYKGAEWMEMKKAEMDKAIKEGNLSEWVKQGAELEQYANYNVWWYYYLKNEVPPYGEYIFERPSEIEVSTLLPYIAVAIAGIVGIVATLWKKRILFKRASLLFIIALVATVYGLFHMYALFPLVFQADLPYPFPHLYSVEKVSEGTAQSMTFFDPENAARVDPYWRVWSFVLYFGITALLIVSTTKAIRFIRT